jgi:hypothetical protein
MRVTAAALVCLSMTVAVPASGQDPAGTSALVSSPATWRVAAGKGSLWIRDVARSRLGRGVDASPVSWEAHGVAFTVERDRSGARRIRRLQASFEHAGDAVFRTPLAAVARPAADRALRLDVTVEHGRYLVVDFGVAGFDVGVGLQGGAELASLTQHFEPSIEVRVEGTNLTSGVAAAARLRRWRRVHFEASWLNGGMFVRTVTHHSAAAEQEVRDWGVGWFSDLTVRTDARMSNKVVLSASYFGTGGGRFVSHGASASGRRRWMVGVSYDW